MRRVFSFLFTACLVLAPFAARAAGGGGAAAIARDIDERFGKACGAGDIAAVVALYAEDATAIYPGQGAVARGRAEIEKLVHGPCDPKSGVVLHLDEARARWLGRDHISVVGRWTLTAPTPGGAKATSEVRTTEILVRTAKGWRFLVDHASVGVPPPAAP